MKKQLPIILFVLGIVIVGIVFVFGKGKDKPTASVTPTQAPTMVRSKPYIALIPSVDGHRISLNVNQAVYADTAEYEIRYERTSEVTKDRIGAGIIGDNIQISGNSFSSGEKLFGSASSGVEKYDKDVQGTDLLVRLRGGVGGTGKYETTWRLSPGSKKITSGDGGFIYEGNLSKSTFYIIMNSVGLPKALDGEIVAGPYAIFTKGDNLVTGKVTINLPPAESSVRIFAWDASASSWSDITSSIKTDGQAVTFSTNKLSTWVVVK